MPDLNRRPIVGDLFITTWCDDQSDGGEFMTRDENEARGVAWARSLVAAEVQIIRCRGVQMTLVLDWNAGDAPLTKPAP